MKSISQFFVLSIALALSTSCNQQPELFGKYQSEDIEIGYEFMEDNKVAILSSEGDTLGEYELIKGKDGYKLNIEILGISQLYDLKESDNDLILSSGGNSITFSPVDEFSIITMGQRAKESEAKNYVGAVQRAQQSFRIERDSFAKSVEELEIGIPLETENFSYQFHNPSDQLTYFTAQAKTTTLRNFLSGVAVKPNGQTYGSSCQSLQPSSTPPPAPIFDGETLQCPEGYEEMN